MGKFYDSLEEKQIRFIEEQKIFFIGTSSAENGINISPKGLYPVKVLDSNRVAYLGLFGTGNRTAKDIKAGSSVTLMFCSFEENPKIVRLFCRGEIVQKGGDGFAKLAALWNSDDGENPAERARNIFLLHIEKVQLSCGFGVPIFSYVGEKRQSATL